MVSCEDKRYHFKHLPLFLFSSQLLSQSMTSSVTKYNLGQFGPVVLAVSPRSSWCTPASLQVGQHENLKHPWFCVSTTLTRQKHLCAIKTIFMKSPKHNTIQASAKKIDSISGQTMTVAELRTDLERQSHNSSKP